VRIFPGKRSIRPPDADYENIEWQIAEHLDSCTSTSPCRSLRATGEADFLISQPGSSSAKLVLQRTEFRRFERLESHFNRQLSSTSVTREEFRRDGDSESIGDARKHRRKEHGRSSGDFLGDFPTGRRAPRFIISLSSPSRIPPPSLPPSLHPLSFIEARSSRRRKAAINLDDQRRARSRLPSFPSRSSSLINISRRSSDLGRCLRPPFVQPVSQTVR